MVTSHDENEAFFDLFADEIATSTPMTARDLAAISIDLNSGAQPNHKTLRSAGSLRFTGHGINGHQGNAEGLFSAGSAFVHLVAAIGSSLLGARSKISENAARLTSLNLDASPEPGSIIFNLIPSIYPETELRPNGEILDDGDQLVDRAIEEIERLMGIQGIDSGDEIAVSLEHLGPMVTRALRTFVTTTSGQYLDVDFAWREPLKASRRWAMNVGDATFLRQVIEGRELDDEAVVLKGYLKTVSMSDSWVFVDDEYGTIVVNISEISGAPWSDHNPEEHIQIQAMMTVREAPGKLTRRQFKAKKFLPSSYSI